MLLLFTPYLRHNHLNLLLEALDNVAIGFDKRLFGLYFGDYRSLLGGGRNCDACFFEFSEVPLVSISSNWMAQQVPV